MSENPSPSTTTTTTITPDPWEADTQRLKHEGFTCVWQRRYSRVENQIDDYGNMLEEIQRYGEVFDRPPTQVQMEIWLHAGGIQVLRTRTFRRQRDVWNGGCVFLAVAKRPAVGGEEAENAPGVSLREEWSADNVAGLAFGWIGFVGWESGYEALRKRLSEGALHGFEHWPVSYSSAAGCNDGYRQFAPLAVRPPRALAKVKPALPDAIVLPAPKMTSNTPLEGYRARETLLEGFPLRIYRAWEEALSEVAPEWEAWRRWWHAQGLHRLTRESEPGPGPHRSHKRWVERQRERKAQALLLDAPVDKAEPIAGLSFLNGHQLGHWHAGVGMLLGCRDWRPTPDAIGPAQQESWRRWNRAMLVPDAVSDQECAWLAQSELVLEGRRVSFLLAALEAVAQNQMLNPVLPLLVRLQRQSSPASLVALDDLAREQGAPLCLRWSNVWLHIPAERADMGRGPARYGRTTGAGRYCRTCAGPTAMANVPCQRVGCSHQ